MICSIICCGLWLEIFLPHLYEPLRIEIAVNYAQHEMRKLLPELRDESLWHDIDKQIGEWPEKLSIRNFWNGIHGISMGFRLKSLVPWITSLNMQWEKKETPIDDIWFGGKFGPVSALNTSESLKDVKEAIFLSENKEILKQTQKKIKELGNDSAPRDNFPIFVVYKKEKFRVIDGNRRLLKVIIDKKDAIRAFVGKPISESPLYEHWVPTSLLVDLVFWQKKQIQSGRDTTEITAQLIAELIRDSSAGRIEFRERAIHHDDEIHMRLLQAIEKIIKL